MSQVTNIDEEISEYSMGFYQTQSFNNFSQETQSQQFDLENENSIQNILSQDFKRVNMFNKPKDSSVLTDSNYINRVNILPLRSASPLSCAPATRGGYPSPRKHPHHPPHLRSILLQRASNSPERGGIYTRLSIQQ